MPNSAKQKGYRIEREIVKLHEDMGIHAERVPLSGGAGGSYTGDVIIQKRFKAEVKARKEGSGFKTLEKWLGDNDLLFLRRDRQKPLVTMTWEMYQEMMSWSEAEYARRDLETETLFREKD